VIGRSVFTIQEIKKKKAEKAKAKKPLKPKGKV
jgi:hypothetical protein